MIFTKNVNNFPDFLALSCELITETCCFLDFKLKCSRPAHVVAPRLRFWSEGLAQISCTYPLTTEVLRILKQVLLSVSNSNTEPVFLSASTSVSV